MYNPYVCDWKVEERKAKSMTIEGLMASIEDARQCIFNGIDSYGKYVDQISIYRKELQSRKGR